MIAIIPPIFTQAHTKWISMLRIRSARSLTICIIHRHPWYLKDLEVNCTIASCVQFLRTLSFVTTHAHTHTYTILKVEHV